MSNIYIDTFNDKLIVDKLSKNRFKITFECGSTSIVSKKQLETYLQNNFYSLL